MMEPVKEKRSGIVDGGQRRMTPEDRRRLEADDAEQLAKSIKGKPTWYRLWKNLTATENDIRRNW